MAQSLCAVHHVQHPFNSLSNLSPASLVDKQAQGKHSPCLVRIHYIIYIAQNSLAIE